jgi:hypothetical protein
MNDFLWRLSIILMLPAAVAVWRHSKLVALAIAWPLAANIYIVARSIDLSVEHPARVLVPAISAAMGFAELYSESAHGKRFSRAAILGLIVFSSGGADIGALPTFSVLHEWAVPPIQCLVCLALVFVSTWKGRFRWESSLLA